MSAPGADALTRGLLLKLVLRALLLQAAWNFERMQHLGFCFALLPLVRRLHPEPASPERGEALRRHLEFFNTHPVMAAAILGAVARLEAEGDGRAAHSCKMSLMGSYGAIGDSFFWGALRPVAGIMGAVTALLWVVSGLPGGAGTAAMVGPAVALALYNVPQLWLRAFGLFAGGRLGIGVVEAIRRFGFPELTLQVRSLGAVALGLGAAALAPTAAGLVAAAAELAGLEGAPETLVASGGLLLGAVLAVLWIFKRGVVPTRLVFVLAAVVLGVTAWL